VEGQVTHIAVHDAARPVADGAMIDRVFEAGEQHGAVIPAVPMRETVKRIEDQPIRPPGDPLDAILGAAERRGGPHRVIQTVSREGLWTVQTPQLFERQLLERAYRQIIDGKIDGAQITDDAGLVEAMGEQVVAVMGDPLNIKITVPDDLKFAEAVAALRGGKIGGSEDPLGPKRKHPTWAQMSDD
jgi:2-C-methyl-D-erythritol 4-phosphate cytidylyltransferase